MEEEFLDDKNGMAITDTAAPSNDEIINNKAKRHWRRSYRSGRKKRGASLSMILRKCCRYGCVAAWEFRGFC